MSATGSPSALRALAIHLETVSENNRSHGGAGWTYDEEIVQLRAAAEELQTMRRDYANIVYGRTIVVPKDKAHAEAMLHVATNALKQ